ncbi:MAG: single-strand DNA-binding protein [Patescibacteria group bacterium]|nr:single-strand DNA-binding protein [Patescibacteria group bacterium]
MYLNKAIIIGNLTRDPEERQLPSGAAVTSFSVATNRVWKDKNGAKQEDTQYHNVVVFGPQARNCAQYLRKGSSVLVEGRMQTRSWDAPDGSKKYRTEIIADRVQFGNRPTGDSGYSQAGATAPASGDAKPEMDTIDYPDEEINPEDIPF